MTIDWEKEKRKLDSKKLNKLRLVYGRSLLTDPGTRLKRRESNKRLCFQPYDIAKGISRKFFSDSVWIVSPIELVVPNSFDDIGPETVATDIHSFTFSHVPPPLITSSSKELVNTFVGNVLLKL